MVQHIADNLLCRLSELIETHLGLHFPQDRWRDVERAVIKAAPSLGLGDLQSCVNRLVELPWADAQVEILARFLTIGETHFFRHEKVFDVLEDEILSELISSRRTGTRHLRVWSAGCATGEEAYSIAMVLNKMLADIGAWNVTILGTDVNRDSLRKATAGVYGQWSFRTVPEGIRERFFLERETGAEVIQTIKNMVRFAHLNLVRDAFPLSTNDTELMDVIFCRNVLMYFSPETQEQVVRNLCRCLNDRGWLIVSPAEASCVSHPQLTGVSFPGVIVYRKDVDAHARPNPFVFSIPELPPLTEPFSGVEMPIFGSRIESQSEFVWPPWPFAEPSPLNERSPTVAVEECDASEPETTEETYQQGLTLFEKGHYPDAAETLIQGFEQNRFDNGDAAKAMVLLARIYANQGKLADALEWAEKSIALDKLDSANHYLHGTILYEQGRLDEAIAAMTRAVFLEPNLVIAHFALGNLARQRGRHKDADRHYRVALKILENYDVECPVPAAEGITAGRLTEMIAAMTMKETSNGRC